MKSTIRITDEQAERLHALVPHLSSHPTWGVNVRAATKATKPDVVALIAFEEGIKALESARAINEAADSAAHDN